MAAKGVLLDATAHLTSRIGWPGRFAQVKEEAAGRGTRSKTPRPPNPARSKRIARQLQRGILPCLRHGFSSFFSRSMTSERQMRLRVSCGRITSSMKPRAPATNGLAKRDLYSASLAASLAGSPLSSRKMIYTAPLAPITAISALGQAKFTSPRRCLELITS